MSSEHVKLVVAEFAVPARPSVPPDGELAEARRLVDSWLMTSFVGRGDSIEELVARIARALAARGAPS
jgi:hypothetical protein